MATNRCQWCFSLCPYPQPAKYRWMSSNCIFTPTLLLISMFTTEFLGWQGDSHPRPTCKCCALPEPNKITLCLEGTTHSIIIAMTIHSLSDGRNGGLVHSGTRKAERKPSHGSQRHLKRGSQSSSLLFITLFISGGYAGHKVATHSQVQSSALLCLRCGIAEGKLRFWDWFSISCNTSHLLGVFVCSLGVLITEPPTL